MAMQPPAFVILGHVRQEMRRFDLKNTKNVHGVSVRAGDDRIKAPRHAADAILSARIGPSPGRTGAILGRFARILE
jgi:hypothetical protein